MDLFTCVKRRAPSSLPMRGSFSSTSVIPDHGYGDNYFKHDNYRATHKLIPTPSLNINDCILRVEVHDTGVGIAEVYRRSHIDKRLSCHRKIRNAFSKKSSSSTLHSFKMEAVLVLACGVRLDTI